MRSSVLLFLFLFGAQVQAQQSQQETANPLQYFEFLVGGEWRTPTTIQTFEWGIGKKSIHSKLYIINNADTTLNGEITWFWHPGMKTIKGYGNLLNQHIDFFDYSTEFTDSRRMNNSIVGYGGSADGVNIIESLEFIGEDQYRWTMYNRVLDQLQPAMSAMFTREN
ncbi:MAG: hypothetical protein JJ895_10455 [Balneolaceae bacterium]|nr:hypothetical protein [Balneolaceae bacterium]